MCHSKLAIYFYTKFIMKEKTGPTVLRPKLNLISLVDFVLF